MGRGSSDVKCPLGLLKGHEFSASYQSRRNEWGSSLITSSVTIPLWAYYTTSILTTPIFQCTYIVQRNKCCRLCTITPVWRSVSTSQMENSLAVASHPTSFSQNSGRYPFCNEETISYLTQRLRASNPDRVVHSVQYSRTVRNEETKGRFILKSVGSIEWVVRGIYHAFRPCSDQCY